MAELGSPPNMVSPVPEHVVPQPGSLPRGDEEGLAKDLEVWQGTGLAELRQNLDDKRVMFAVMRFALGSGKFRRLKFCFLHIVGLSLIHI